MASTGNPPGGDPRGLPVPAAQRADGLAMEPVVVAPVEGGLGRSSSDRGISIGKILPTVGRADLDKPEPVWPPGDRACICIGRDHKGRMTGPQNVGKGKIGNRNCENIPNTEWGRWLEYASCFCK